MKVTTWNVNSVRARVHLLPDWLDRHRPDVLCLQELKCQEHQFPAELFEERGYNLVLAGQKTYNGVAIASLHPISGLSTDFPVPGDGQARGIAAVTAGLRVVNVYVVNGKEPGDDAYDYKLHWLAELRRWLSADTAPDDDVVLCGDFNVAPDDRDVHDPDLWRGRVPCTGPERRRFSELLDWGLTDAWRHLNPQATGPSIYTWWDYRRGAFRRDHGLRIDHHLVTASVLARAREVRVDRESRAAHRPSDHAPLTLVLD